MNLTSKQHGTAIITALLVVVIAALIATWLLTQQAQSLSRVERTVERTQISAYANTAIDWSRAILYDDAKKGATYTHPRQGWQSQVQTSPADGILATGVMNDAQARFNVNQLVDDNGKASEPDIAVFRRLLTELTLDPNLADAIVDFIDRDDDTRGANGAENGYYTSLSKPYRAANRLLVHSDELARTKGVTGEVMRRLNPFIVALPATASKRVPINLNTAPTELLAALFGGAGSTASSDTVTDIARLRELPFSSVADFKERFKTVDAQVADRFTGVKSQHFLLTAALVGNGAALRQTALLQVVINEGAIGWPRIIWVKET